MLYSGLHYTFIIFVIHYVSVNKLLTLYLVCHSSLLPVDVWHSDKSYREFLLYINSCLFYTYQRVGFPVAEVVRSQA